MVVGGRRALGVALTTLALGGCRAQVLDPAGPIGAGERTILLNSLAIMLCIVVPVIVLAIGFAWWFRAGNDRARYLPDWAYSGRIEAVVWSIPVLVILFLGGITWVGSHELDPDHPIASKAPPLEVQVVSLDWKWLFIYPAQGIATVNRLVIPAGVPVRFRITSASVMNTFFVPRLGGMIYSMNGMESRLNLQADKPGRYYGRSGHFSGDGFPGMEFWVDAVPPAQFAAWTAQARGRGGALDAARYRRLAQQSADDPPMLFGRVQPGLYQAVVRQALPPAPGPRSGEPANVRPMSVSPPGSEGHVG